MEMEFKDTGRRRRMMVVMIGAVLAAAAGIGAFTLASKGTPVEATPKKAVLVASHDVLARTQITADDLTVREVPVDEALTQAYVGAAEVVGRTTSVPIYADQQITPNLFATTSADADFSILAPGETVDANSPFWRAVAVQIPADRAVGGEVKDGQHVDLVVSVDIVVLTLDDQGNYIQTDTASQDGYQTGKSTKITFQDIEVLKANPDNDMYVFKVDLHQAEQIAHIIQLAPDSFTIVLRPDEDTRAADTTDYGTTTDRLIMTYLYPAPRLIDLSQLGDPPAVGSPAPGSTPLPGGSPTDSPAPAESPAASGEPSPSASPAP